MIRIAGGGFGNVPLFCIFTSQGGERETSPAATVLSPATALCETPLWPHGAGAATITIETGEGTPVEHAGMASLPTFRFTASVLGVDPSSGPASVENVTVVGASLSTSLPFECVIISQSSTVNHRPAAPKWSFELLNNAIQQTPETKAPSLDVPKP